MNESWLSSYREACNKSKRVSRAILYCGFAACALIKASDLHEAPPSYDYTTKMSLADDYQAMSGLVKAIQERPNNIERQSTGAYVDLKNGMTIRVVTTDKPEHSIATYVYSPATPDDPKGNEMIAIITSSDMATASQQVTTFVKGEAQFDVQAASENNSTALTATLTDEMPVALEDCVRVTIPNEVYSLYNVSGAEVNLLKFAAGDATATMPTSNDPAPGLDMIQANSPNATAC